jgi:hypothetical protein
MSVYATSRYFIGGAIKNIALSDIDISKILSKITQKTYQLFKYGDLKPETELVFYNIILYQYDNDMGHWVLLRCNTNGRELYFFDSYGNKPDGAWPYLINTKGLPEPRHVLSEIIQRYISNGYKFSYNGFNIQGNLKDQSLADSECGELVILRILNEQMTDKQFYDYCLKLGRFQIFQLVKYLDERNDEWVNVQPKKK